MFATDEEELIIVLPGDLANFLGDVRNQIHQMWTLLLFYSYWVILTTRKKSNYIYLMAVNPNFDSGLLIFVRFRRKEGPVSCYVTYAT